MKRLSITKKITIWYAVFLVLITVGFLCIMVYVGNARASELAKTRLTEAVTDAREEIDSVGEDFIIDKDLEFYDDGVYISVYEEDGKLIEGRRPAELGTLPRFDDGEVVKAEDSDGHVWYIYDSRFDLDGRQIWVRGIVKDFAEEGTFSFALRIALIALPALVILAGIGGYAITRRAFKPVRDITATAEKIGGGSDLSRRIELGDHGKPSAPGSGGDEIHRLAHTFNDMFERLEKSFEQEKQFTSDVSHELRTPLSVIISQSDYAREDEEYREKALEVINREAKRMSGLVSRLLTLARSDSGRLDPGSESVDLSEMCRMVAGQQEYAAEEKDIGIVTDIEDGISVRGDEAMLIRVLLNLVDNAIKYGRTGGYVRIALERRGDEAVMSVADDGEGISEKDLARIWERFYRVDPSRSEEGSGLGLSMVEALVKAHGGRVEAESVPGEGSCFRVYLPVGRN